MTNLNGRLLKFAQYSSNTIVQMESRFDHTLAHFVKRLGQFADSGDVIDFAFWVSLFTFDTLAEIGFSRSFDLLETGVDNAGIVNAVQRTTPLLIAFSHVHWLVKICRSTLAKSLCGQPRGASFLEKVRDPFSWSRRVSQTDRTHSSF
jgi:Cytochrome P450